MNTDHPILDAYQGPPEGPDAQVLDWRKWVPPQVRREILGFMCLAFAVGVAVSVVAAWIYASFSESKDKVFHCAIILGACGFTMPAFACSIRIMLTMFYMNWRASEDSRSMIADLKEVKDEAKPILETAGRIVTRVEQLANQYAKDDVVKALIAEVKRELDAKDGVVGRFESRLDALVKAVETIGSPLGDAAPRRPGLLESGIATPEAPGNGSAHS